MSIENENYNLISKYNKILIATSNNSKLKEIKEILINYDLISLKDINKEIDIDENGKTFEDNSLKKAKSISLVTGFPCIADDSGLCIDIFNGWPGIYTSRFLGDNVTDRQKNEKILEKMKGLKGKERKAKVVCAVTYYNNGKHITVSGEIKGKISKEFRGNNGFGFDEIFELEDGNTLAELSAEGKNNISARKVALELLQEKLEKFDF